MSKKHLFEPLQKEAVGVISMALVLDPRKHSEAIKELKAIDEADLKEALKISKVKLPVAVRIIRNRFIYYYKTGLNTTFAQWNDIKTARSGTKSEASTLRKTQLDQFSKVVAIVRELDIRGTFSREELNARLKGREAVTFLDLWQEIISKRKFSTAESYKAAYKCFIQYAGKDVSFERISPEYVQKWADYMKDKGLSATTMGIYMRAFRVAVSRCQKLGKIKPVQWPFGKEDMGKVRVLRGNDRKYNVIDRETIEKIRFFHFPDDWTYEVKRSIDLFLFSYLAGGANIRDLADLRWCEHYFFRSGKTELRFIRNKTKDTSDRTVEVIIPIIPEVQSILDKWGSLPELGERVFPWILGTRNPTEDQVFRRVQQANQNVRKHLARVCSKLELPQRITPTWARHSFKTNSMQAGIPRAYTEQAMGHTISGPEGNYAGLYPAEDRMKFSNMLLGTRKQGLIEQLQALNREELKELLEIVEKNQTA
mgnify:FL=1